MRPVNAESALFKDNGAKASHAGMLCNARIRDSRGGKRKEQPQLRKKGWKVKWTRYAMFSLIRREVERGSTAQCDFCRSTELSPFSELVLGGSHRELSL